MPSWIHLPSLLRLEIMLYLKLEGSKLTTCVLSESKKPFIIR